MVTARPPQEREAQELTERESELEAIGRLEVGALEWLARVDFRTAITWAGQDRQRLQHMARSRGYKPGWVHYRLLEPQGFADGQRPHRNGQGPYRDFKEPGKGFAQPRKGFAHAD